MDPRANQRWYTSTTPSEADGIDTSTGEVRVEARDRHLSGAYFLTTSPPPAVDDQCLWLSNQLNGAVADEQYSEDFSWINDIIDDLLVPDEKCRFAWGAARGRIKGDHWVEADPAYREKYRDVIAVILSADLYNDPEDPGKHFRIATFPIGAWADREDAVREGLLAMAKQRFSREMIVGQVARESREVHDFFGEPHPLPGLRLTRNIKRDLGDDPDATLGEADHWDLTSAQGGLDAPVPSQVV